MKWQYALSKVKALIALPSHTNYTTVRY